MNYHCKNGDHEWIEGSLVCCCGEIEFVPQCFTGTVGELERLINDQIEPVEFVM